MSKIWLAISQTSDYDPTTKETPTGAQAKADAAKEAIALNLGYTDYADMLAKATAGSTIIDGGYIRTILLDVNDIIATGSIIVTGSNISDLTNDSGFTDDSTVNALAPAGLVEFAKLGTTIITGGYIKSTLLDIDTIIASGSIIVTGSNISDLTNDSGFTDDTTANTKAKTFYQAYIPTSSAIGDLWVDTDDNNTIYRAESVGANEITAGEWVKLAIEIGSLGTTIISGDYIKTGLVTADNVITGRLQNLTGTTYFDLDDAEIKLTATVNGNDSVVTLNPTVGFEITTNGLPIYEIGKYPIKTQAHFASGQCILGSSDTEVFFANELEDIPDAVVLTPINDDTAICTAMTYLLSATSFHAYASSGCAAFYMAMVNSKTYFYRMEISDTNWVVGDSNGNYSQNNTSAYLYLNGYADVGVEGRATYVLDVPVDLTYFKTLYVEWENTGTASDYNFSYLNVASTEQGDYNDNIIGGIDLTNTFSKKISTLNISAMNNTYYIRAHARAITDSITSEIKVYRIWAE